jgi:restriction system protein
VVSGLIVTDRDGGFTMDRLPEVPDWKRYQSDTSELFKELGCDVETDVEVTEPRGKHLLDVSIPFSRFGLPQHWIVVCKFWNRAIPKKEVLILKSIVEDIGADRGILIAESGHQSCASASASHTNITLASLPQLREGATNEY